jgi:hypothetical protein
MSETIEILESKYRELAEAHGEATQRGDHKAANKNHDGLVALVPKLRALGDKGEAALIGLMNDSSEAVACWAATHCLPFAELAALGVLDTLAKKTGPIGFDARMVAEMWRSGQLVIR